jgi:tRNA uridine 5-carbamoylmethylation protein Kti12|tara:strand:+ start:3744 stop:4274 length:531 start_codon:yes stop_codon:yes gene_type:complete
MKLIFIYGLPAVGKLTVANELSKITNFSIIHNHLTVDLLSPVLEVGKGKFWEYMFKLRFEVLKIAIKENIDIIFTSCYAKKVDDSYLKRYINLINKNKGKIYFVQLKCDDKVLFQRIKKESRKKYGKLKNINGLKKLLKELELRSPIPFVDSYTIDNTNLSANKTALKIKKHFKLK